MERPGTTASGAAGADPLTVSVIICAHALERWHNLVAAVGSVAGQTRPPLETIVVIDGNTELQRTAREGLVGAVVIANAHRQGLSGARQTGSERASGSIVAFIDDDAVADPDWLEWLSDPYGDPLVLGVGGLIEPSWLAPAPAWFPDEFNWVVGCTYTGMPETTSRVRNPIGANMSVRARVIAESGSFDPRMGRIPTAKTLAGSAEETEFCIRAAREHPGHYWIYEPKARVRHLVPPQRGSWGYFVRRCAVEGTAKARLSQIAGSSDGLRAERAYVRSVLPRALVRELRGALGGRRGALARAGAICAGVSITAGTYAWASLRERARPG